MTSLKFPMSRERPGIYWLRLFREDGGYIAIVTEVPGNPSCSVTNGIEDIAHHVTEEFQIPLAGFSLYQIHPKRYAYSDANIRRVTIDYTKDYTTQRWWPSWDEVTRAEIESHIGCPLPELPVHGDLYPRVLDRGGGLYKNIYRDIFEAMDAKDLPSFHNAFSCTHSRRFKRMIEDAKGLDNQPLTFEGWLRVGREFTESLTKEDMDSCYYHQADWKAIADESVRIITESGQQDASVYKRAARQSQLQGRDRRWLESLFDDPIKVYERAYHDGQHRGCALRFSGADRAAVVVGSEQVDRRCVDWHYWGDG